MNSKIPKQYSQESRFERTVSLLIIVTMVFLIFYLVTLSWFGESADANKVIIVGDVKIRVYTAQPNPEVDLNITTLEPNKEYSKPSVLIIGNAENSNPYNEVSNPGGVKDEDVGNAYIRAKIITVKSDSNGAPLTTTAQQQVPVLDDNGLPKTDIDGQQLYQTITVEVYDEIFDSEGKPIVTPLFNTPVRNNWYYALDDEATPDVLRDNSWYYLKGSINNATNTTFLNGLKVSNDLSNTHKNEHVVILLIVEAIQTQYNAFYEWNAPVAWQNIILAL